VKDKEQWPPPKQEQQMQLPTRWLNTWKSAYSLGLKVIALVILMGM
jgi:hypothetical protein